MKTVRIAMLGSGFLADFYMQGLRDVPGQEVVAVYSRTRASAQRLAARWRIADATDDLDALCRRSDFDLAIIALPNHLHRSVSLLLAKAGKHQVCTKPLGRNAAEARQMLEAVEQAGVMNGYGETEVFAPAVVRAEQIVRSGAIGRVQWIRSRESHGGPHSQWFRDADLSGGGVLLDMGCHCIETARYLLGKHVAPQEVMAWGEALEHGSGVEDNALAVIRFEDRSIAHLEVSWTARGGLDLRNEVHGSEGSVLTDVTRSTPLRAFTRRSAGYVVEKSEADTGWTSPVPEEAYTYGYQAELKHFVECVRDGAQPRETYRDGYIVNCVLDAAYRSLRSRSWEKVEA